MSDQDFPGPDQTMNSCKTKIAILGAGSIGCFLGGMLQHGGCEVIFIGRERIKTTISEHGLTLTHYEKQKISLPSESVRVETDPSALSEADLILICTKSQDTEKAACLIKKHAKSKAHIVSCQNGISNVPLLRDILGNKVKTISGAIVPFNVTPTGPGSYHCGTGGALHIEHALPDVVKTAFASVGQSIKIGGNFTGDQWAKLLVNLNNALNTLSGGTLREGLVQKDYRKALALIVEEGLDVAHAHDVRVGDFNGRSPETLIKTLRLPNWIYKIVMQLIVKIDAKARSSMLDDLEAGRVSEVDYLQGEIVRQANAVKLKASYNKAILKSVQGAFEKGKSPYLTGTQILGLLKS